MQLTVPINQTNQCPAKRESIVVGCQLKYYHSNTPKDVVHKKQRFKIIISFHFVNRGAYVVEVAYICLNLAATNTVLIATGNVWLIAPFVV